MTTWGDALDRNHGPPAFLIVPLKATYAFYNYDSINVKIC
jgi:hypothetical protein